MSGSAPSEQSLRRGLLKHSARLLLVMLAAGQWTVSEASAQGQPYFWNNAAGGDFFVPNNWSPFGVPGTGDGAYFGAVGTSDNSYTVTFGGNVLLSAMSFSPPPNSVFRQIAGSLGMSGPNGLGSSTLAITNGTYILSGGSLNIGATSSMGVTSTDMFVLQQNGTLGNSGTILFANGTALGGGTLINLGTIVGLSSVSGTTLNTGTIYGPLIQNGGTLNNTGTITGGLTVNGGYVTGSMGTPLTVTSGTLADLQVNAGASLGNGGIVLAGTIVNNSTITTSPGSISPATGTVLTNNPTATFTLSGGQFTDGGTINNSGLVRSSGIMEVKSALNNSGGTIDAQSGQLLLMGGGALSGTTTLNGSGRIQLLSGTFTLAPGATLAGDNTLVVAGNNVNSAILTGTIQGRPITWTGGTLRDVQINSGITITDAPTGSAFYTPFVSNTLTNNSTVVLTTSVYAANSSSTWVNAAGSLLDMQGSASLSILSGGTPTFVNHGTVRFSSGSNSPAGSSSWAIGNAGLVDIQSGVFVASAPVTNSGTVRVAANATLYTTLTNNAGGLVAGRGQISGTITLNGGSVVSPGDGLPGRLYVGSTTFGPDAAYAWRISSWADGATPGTDFSQLFGSGSSGATLDLSALSASHTATIRVVGLAPGGMIGSVAGFDPSQSRSWVIAHFDAISPGADPSVFGIDTASFESANPGVSFSLSFTLSGDVVLTATPVPEPAVLLLWGSLLVAIFVRLRRQFASSVKWTPCSGQKESDPSLQPTAAFRPAVLPRKPRGPSAPGILFPPRPPSTSAEGGRGGKRMPSPHPAAFRPSR